MEQQMWYVKKWLNDEWQYRTVNTIEKYNKMLKWGWFRVDQEEYERGNAADEAPAGSPGDAGAETAGAYTYRGGAIQWEDGYAAIEQLALSCVGSKDTRYLQETLNAIYSIAVTEREQAALQAGRANADGGRGGEATSEGGGE